MVARESPRVIVGVDESLPGLRALRCAVDAARQRRCALVAVRAWWVTPTWPLELSASSWREGMRQEALAYIIRAFTAAMVGPPPGVAFERAAPEGAPGPELARLAEREDDLVVIGSRQPTLLGRLRHGATARHCLQHANCPVLVVPPHSLARTGTVRALSQELVDEARRLVDMADPG